MVQNTDKTVFIFAHVLTNLTISVAKFCDDRLDDLLIQLVISINPIILLWLRLLREATVAVQVVRVVLGVSGLTLRTAHKVVDYVEVIVDHITTRHNVLTFEKDCCA
jgi:hypothetical protein